MRKIKEEPIIVMNFSGVYCLEPFADNEDFVHVDCSDIPGTDCILSAEAAQTLTSRISSYGARGIHFIDSGNYHYMTRLWTDKIHSPFTLILIDHHSDMQQAQEQGYLTCGNWVGSVVENNKWLRKVLIIGVPDEKAQEAADSCPDKVEFVSRKQCLDLLAGHGHPEIEGKIYLSIDKDALSPACAVTNWDQGEISLNDLKRLVFLFVSNENLIGIDVCGEFSATKSLFEEAKGAEMDNHANEAILHATEDGLQSKSCHRKK